MKEKLQSELDVENPQAIKKVISISDWFERKEKEKRKCVITKLVEHANSLGW